jgi:seryl-tRNA synthetase
MDINAFREDKGGNPEMVRESQRRRFAPVEDVDVVIEKDKAWRAGAYRPSSPSID